MHDQSEFQYDPVQDRPGARRGQEWVELEAWPFEALRGSLSAVGCMSWEQNLGVPRVQLHALTSCTVRPTAPQKGLETRRNIPYT